MAARGALHLPACPLHGRDDLLGFLGAPAFRVRLLLQGHAGVILSIPWTFHGPILGSTPPARKPYATQRMSAEIPHVRPAGSTNGSPAAPRPAGPHRRSQPYRPQINMIHGLTSSATTGSSGRHLDGPGSGRWCSLASHGSRWTIMANSSRLSTGPSFPGAHRLVT